MPEHIQKFALIVAGGSGLRMGADVPKQMLELNGKPILVHTIHSFFQNIQGIRVCLVLNPDLLKSWRSKLENWFSEIENQRIILAEGGDSRTQSVSNGLEKIYAEVGDEDIMVAIHDAVRPFIHQEMLEAGFLLCSEKGNAVAAVPVKSSLRKKTENGSIAVDRNEYFHVQTPQIFHLFDIIACYRSRLSDDYTDDASLAESAGLDIHLFDGSYENIKITTPEDLALAEILINKAGNV